MDEKQALIELGLSKTESIIYMSLLRTKDTSVVKISKETQLHRRTIYDNLNILINKGLVSFKIKDNSKFFEATNPDNFKVFLREKESILDSILPNLTKKYERNEIQPKINIHLGINGAKLLIEKAIESRKNLFWVGGGAILFDKLGFSKNYYEKKLSSVNIKTVQPKLKKTLNLQFIKEENIRYLPKEFASETGYLVFGENLIISIIQENQINSIEIISESCAKAFMNYFNLLWEQGK
jgi:sugar-specific transcriptional regulator TrmB